MSVCLNSSRKCMAHSAFMEFLSFSFFFLLFCRRKWQLKLWSFLRIFHSWKIFQSLLRTFNLWKIIKSHHHALSYLMPYLLTLLLHCPPPSLFYSLVSTLSCLADIVLIYYNLCYLNPLTPNNGWPLISPYISTLQSNV